MEWSITDRKGDLAVEENSSDDPEFTTEELRAALKRVGQTAREEAFAAGLPVYVLRGTTIVARHADGSETVVETLEPPQPALDKP
jgi:hypothetical protein